MSGIIVSQAEGPIAEITLSRPEKKNAVTLELLDALVATAEDLATRPGLRAVILRGAGGDFSAGMDLNVLMGMAGDLSAVKREMLDLPDGVTANRFQRPAQALAEIPAPVIAALDGVCFGAGIQLALAADFRIAAPDARLSVMEAKWGLIPDMGISLSLPRLMPVDRAKALILNGDILSGEAALAAGLVTRLAADPQAAAREMAAGLAAKSPDAVRAGKRLVDQLWGPIRAENLALEARLQADLMGAPNQVETVMAQMQKRPPVYT